MTIGDLRNQNSVRSCAVKFYFVCLFENINMICAIELLYVKVSLAVCNITKRFDRPQATKLSTLFPSSPPSSSFVLRHLHNHHSQLPARPVYLLATILHSRCTFGISSQ